MQIQKTHTQRNRKNISFLVMKALRIYSLHFHMYYTAILTIIIPSIYLPSNWKIITLDHLVIIVLEFYFCSMLSCMEIHDQNSPIKLIMAFKMYLLIYF